jgi:hypothetical protein
MTLQPPKCTKPNGQRREPSAIAESEAQPGTQRCGCEEPDPPRLSISALRSGSTECEHLRMKSQGLREVFFWVVEGAVRP